ncbi:MAG: hypothetical protein ACXVHW_10590 [Methanobacterium sp.]
MKTGVFFGYKCPKCGSKVDLTVVVGTDKNLCPKCKTIMESDPEGTISMANVRCSNCNSFFGLINSDKCPNCGTNF